MILPSKHLNLSESLFGLGALIISMLDKSKSIDEIWLEINSISLHKGNYQFDDLVLGLDYLYIIGVINIDNEGRIFKCN